MMRDSGAAPGRLREALALVAACILLAATPHGQTNPQAEEARIERLRHWMSLARAHTRGTVDDPVREVRAYYLSALTELQDDFEAYLEFWNDPGLNRVRRSKRPYSGPEQALLAQLAATETTNGTGNSLLRQIAMLHTDAMVLSGAVTFLVPDKPNAGGEPVTMTSDGVGLGGARTSPLWPIARVAVGGLHPNAKDDAWARQWYEATTSVLLYGSQFATLPAHLRERQALMPDDAGAVFDEACVYEAFANDRIQNVAASERARGRDLAVPSRLEALSRAKRTFEAVLTRDMNHIEARLRLGRVLWALGEFRRSADELAAVTQKADATNELRYLAHLFLGESRWSLGEPALAAESYQAALALYPKAQSPVVGLLLVKPRFTDDDLARSERMLALPATDRRDPWLDYHLGAGRFARDRMDALWAARIAR